ncbi:unnamed protein product [Ceutorhynchus assimilis]|uniref:Uncharacterized protein n=1 Tax=Ceutorhynchus assimilis TaxID=467358 RepID=A0A9N9MHR6_9CUCU|nr:unnamed protein product [Ceutorhynchus assimilis]
MTSKEFKQTAKTVRTNFQKHARAMDSDIQMLIHSLLDVIDSKIVALKKLLKLRAYIHNIAATDYIVDEPKTDSLEDFSSMIYEADQNSLPSDNDEQKRKFQADIADLKSLCQNPKKTLDKYIYLSDIKPQQLQETKDSLVHLGKADYESVLDILNMVLKSYKLQEDVKSRRTRSFVDNNNNNNNGQEIGGRKIASDSVCLGARKLKNIKKHTCSV